ncbi:MAG: ATP-binding cassette domain-containing protein [Alphaproteobacteria bacterium]
MVDEPAQGEAIGHDAPTAAAPVQGTPVVQIRHLHKRYGNVVALDEINLEIGSNEVLGLIGDNGAGKSTLIKILTGVERPTAGEILVRGQPIDFGRYGVRQAHALGIETVYQEKSLGEKQPLWRNFFIGRNITNRLGFIKVKEQKALAGKMLMGSIGFRGVGINVDATAGNLSGGERQGICIGRAMYFDADLIVLDEPTVALAVKEVRKVLNFIEEIKRSGRACLYVEHNLAHVHEMADRMVIIDRGRVAGEVRRGEMTVAELTEYFLSLQAEREAAA